MIDRYLGSKNNVLYYTSYNSWQDIPFCNTSYLFLIQKVFYITIRKDKYNRVGDQIVSQCTNMTELYGTYYVGHKYDRTPQLWPEMPAANRLPASITRSSTYLLAFKRALV